MMLLNEAGYHFPTGLERMNRGLFIVTHEATVAFDIGAEDGSEFAFHRNTYPAAIILLARRVCQTVREENLGMVGTWNRKRKVDRARVKAKENSASENAHYVKLHPIGENH
jgi:hypothetical protein